MSAEYENQVVGENQFSHLEKQENEEEQNEKQENEEQSEEEQSEEEERTPIDPVIEAKLKEIIDERVHFYLSQMKNMFMMELITHLLDQKRTYEMEDNEFNKLSEDEKKTVNKFIKDLTTK